MENSPWLLTIISASAPIFVGIWTFIQWFTSRKDKNRELELTQEEKREAELEKERHEILENYTLINAQLKADIDRYRKIIEEKNIERWYAWDRARYWHQIAWDMRNEAAYARQIVESACRLAGEPPKQWEASLNMPPFDANAQTNSQPPKQTA